MISRKSQATIVAFLIGAVGLLIALDRGGVLAWAGCILGIALLLKISLRPSRIDLLASIGAAAIWALAWVGTIYYVVSVWESGEVVVLAVEMPNETHTVRVWVVDIDESLVLYYDAEPEIAEAMISDQQVSVTRADQLLEFTRVDVRTADDVPEAELNQIFQLLEDKYGSRNEASALYAMMVGRSRDRVGVVLTLAN